jgi:hypothetical protein
VWGVNDSIPDQLGRLFGGEWRDAGRYGIAGTAATMFVRVEETGTGHVRVTGFLAVSDGPDHPITARFLQTAPLVEIEEWENLARHKDLYDEIKTLPPLRREEGEEPEAFSVRVGHYYRLFAAVFPNPVATMSAYYKIKSPTMHAWIREARLRGEDLPKVRP